MIDTHAHLSDRFKQEVNLDSLKWVVLSASCRQDSLDNLELAKTNKKLLPAVGIHPMEKTDNIDEAINFLDELCQENKNIAAIGECGLEFTDEVDKKKQEILFRGQISLSLKYQKTLIIHSREAAEETVEILKSYKNLTGVIHCYTGGKKRIKKYLEISPDWYFGVDGNVTYEAGLEEVVKNIPKDRLVLETDTPFLTPIPHRGETNRPEYVRYIYQKVAEIWGVSFAETEEIVDNNAQKLFLGKK
jgi:TatD DNase family protein